MIQRILSLSLLIAALPLAASAQAPDVIFSHAIILTGSQLAGHDDGSSTPRIAQAIAITGTTVSAIGSDQQILALRGPRTQVVDLAGAFVMPGFNDAHTHIAAAGQQQLTVDLDHVPSLAAMQQRIRVYAATAVPGSWITGAGWDHTLWPGSQLPTRQALDAVTAGHPAVFSRTDGHIVVANSAALAAAGITASTPNPAGGSIDHAPDGSPTGIVREGPATDLIFRRVPPPDTATRTRALQFAMQQALSFGVTSVQDFSDWDDWLILVQMERDRTLNLRVSEWLPFATPLPTLEAERASHSPDDPLLHLGFLKAFMDGSLGSRTAALAEPYSDQPANSGIPRYQQAPLDALAKARVAAHFQLGFHAIGDRANAMALDAFAAATPDYTPAARAALRLRIEHAQVLLPQDFDRFAALGVIASMQPSHLLTDMAWAPARLGPERSRYAYAWRSMLQHHVTLAFGTDYPVESISPFRGLYSAITRQNEAGTQTFFPDQKLTIEEALYAYTQASAFAEFREHRKGRLEPGMLADLVVLDRDLLHAAPQQVLHTRVLRTVVGGRTVYLAPPQ